MLRVIIFYLTLTAYLFAPGVFAQNGVTATGLFVSIAVSLTNNRCSFGIAGAGTCFSCPTFVNMEMSIGLPNAIPSCAPPQCLATIKLLTDIEAEYVLIPLGYDFKVAVLVDDSSWQTDELHAAKLLSVKRTVANVNNWPIPDDQQLKDC